MYVCMYVCMYVYVYVHVHMNVRIIWMYYFIELIYNLKYSLVQNATAMHTKTNCRMENDREIVSDTSGGFQYLNHLKKQM